MRMDIERVRKVEELIKLSERFKLCMSFVCNGNPSLVERVLYLMDECNDFLKGFCSVSECVSELEFREESVYKMELKKLSRKVKKLMMSFCHENPSLIKSVLCVLDECDDFLNEEFSCECVCCKLESRMECMNIDDMSSRVWYVFGDVIKVID